jgi:hypothetical protein
LVRELSLGTTGPDVARWERFLLRAGHLSAAGRGTFDQTTETATRAFQVAKGLSSTSRADGVTLARALEGGLLDAILNGDEAPKEAATRRTDWTVFVPLMVAVLGGLFAAIVALLNSRNDIEKNLVIEREKLRSSIVLQAIGTNDPSRSVANLRFFNRLGFLDLDEGQLRRMEEDPATAPVLPGTGGVRPLTQNGPNLLAILHLRKIPPLTRLISMLIGSRPTS